MRSGRVFILALVRTCRQLHGFIRRCCVKLLRFLIVNVAKISICCCVSLVALLMLLMLLSVGYSFYFALKHGHGNYQAPLPLPQGLQDDELADTDDYEDSPPDWVSFRQRFLRESAFRAQQMRRVAEKRKRHAKFFRRHGRGNLAVPNDFIDEDPFKEEVPTDEPQAEGQRKRPFKAANVGPPAHLSRKSRDTHSQLKSIEAQSKRQCRTSSRGTGSNSFAGVEYRLAESHACQSEVELLILVRSRWSNVARRRLIRSTYGSLNNVHDTIVRLVFIVGLPEVPNNHKKRKRWQKRHKNVDEDLQLLLQESDTFRDLVIGEFPDAPPHELFKDFLALHWTVNFCPTAKYVAKLDDHTFLDTVHLANFLHHIPDKDFLYCSVVHQGRKPPRSVPSARRRRRKSVFVPPGGDAAMEHRRQQRHPPHCRSVGFVASAGSVAQMLGCGQRLRWLLPGGSDTFFTGLVVEHARLKLVDTWKGHSYGELNRQTAMPPAANDYIFLAAGRRQVSDAVWKLAWKLLMAQYDY